MDNPSFVGEETTANCAEERSQHNVDEAKPEMKTFSCPDCGTADRNPAAKFCWNCGCKLKVNKVPEEKGIVFWADVKISHESLSKQFVHKTKVLTKLFQNMEKRVYGILIGYDLITQNTFQNNACFTIFRQFHNDGSKKTNANPNPLKALTLPKTLL